MSALGRPSTTRNYQKRKNFRLCYLRKKRYWSRSDHLSIYEIGSSYPSQISTANHVTSQHNRSRSRCDFCKETSLILHLRALTSPALVAPELAETFWATVKKISSSPPPPSSSSSTGAVVVGSVNIYVKIAENFSRSDGGGTHCQQ